MREQQQQRNFWYIKFIDFSLLFKGIQNSFINLELFNLQFCISYQVNSLSNIVTELLNHLKGYSNRIFHSEWEIIKFSFSDKTLYEEGLFCRKFFSTLLSEKVFPSLWKFVWERNNKNISRPRASTLRTHCAAKTCNFEGFGRRFKVHFWFVDFAVNRRSCRIRVI